VRDATLRRVRVTNADGDVYLETGGEHAEVVLQTNKVRVDGDVYCGDSDVGLAESVNRMGAKFNEENTAMSKRLADLNATDITLRRQDAAMSNRIDALAATDAEMKGVDSGLESRIDALTDIWVNELNTTDRQLIVTDAHLGSRIDKLNASYFLLRGVDEGLHLRIDSVNSSVSSHEREVDALLSEINSSLDFTANHLVNFKNETTERMRLLQEKNEALQNGNVLLSERVDNLNETDYKMRETYDNLTQHINTLEVDIQRSEKERNELKRLVHLLNASLSFEVEKIHARVSEIYHLPEPPICRAPGGRHITFNGTSWSCICNSNWSGASCDIPSGCDVSKPRNGELGNCTTALAHDTVCIPTCDVGYFRSGVTSCSAGVLIDEAFCLRKPVLWTRFNDPSIIGKDYSDLAQDMRITGQGVGYAFDAERGGVLKVTNCDHLESEDYHSSYPRGSSSYTFGMWFKVNVSSTRNAYNQGWGMAAIGATGACGQNKAAILSIGALSRVGKLSCGHWCNDMFGPAGSNNDALGENVADGSWHHVAVTYDAETLVESLYEDFTLLATKTAGVLNIQPGKVYIGDGSPVLEGLGGDDIKCVSEPGGLIDDFALFDQALSQEELEEFANMPAGIRQILEEVKPETKDDNDLGCANVSPPAKGNMGTCTETLSNGMSCNFSCAGNSRLSGTTTCNEGVLESGRCIPRLDNVSFTCEKIASSTDNKADIVAFPNVKKHMTDLLHMPERGKINLLTQTSPRVFESSTMLTDVPLGARFCMKGVHDFNGDGITDFFLVGGGRPNARWGGGSGSADVMYMSSTDGSYEVQAYENTYWGYRCDSADFDGDGFLDVVAQNIWFSDPARIYLHANPNDQPAQSWFDGPVSVSGSPRFAHDVTHGDFDGDGILDLVIVSSDGHGDYVYFGTGTGTFTDALRVSAGSRGSVAACDVNSDGHLDLIIGDYYASRSLQVYINKGDGSRTSMFDDVTQIPSLTTMYGLACDDIDGDGLVDLVVSQTDASRDNFVMWNSGSSPFFSQANALVLPEQLNSQVQLLDLDGDGLLDIIGRDTICWQGEVGQCVDIYAPEHGSLGDCTLPMLDGASCNFTCEEGYVLSGSSQCTNGVFAPGECKPVEDRIFDFSQSASNKWVCGATPTSNPRAGASCHYDANKGAYVLYDAGTLSSTFNVSRASVDDVLKVSVSFKSWANTENIYIIVYYDERKTTLVYNQGYGTLKADYCGCGYSGGQPPLIELRANSTCLSGATNINSYRSTNEYTISRLENIFSFSSSKMMTMSLVHDARNKFMATEIDNTMDFYETKLGYESMVDDCFLTGRIVIVNRPLGVTSEVHSITVHGSQ